MTTQKYITLNNTNIYYELYGAGIPILIIHGWGINLSVMTECLEPVFHDMNQTFKRIYIDLPGMGKSEVNEDIRTADDVLNILLAFLDAIIPQEPFLIVGESWGGILAKGIILDRPSSIKGLCLVCSTPFFTISDSKPINREVIEIDSDFINSLSSKEKQVFTSVAVVQNREAWNKFKRNIYPALTNRNLDYLTNTLTGNFKDDILSAEVNFDEPVLVLLGKQDHIVGYKNQVHDFIDFPHATIAVLDVAGHSLQIEQEEVFAVLVHDWLKRVLRSYKQ